MTRRAGRPRKPAVSRQPNGRSRESNDRARREESAIAVAVAQRLHHGATPENALDQRHSTPVGRLYLAGRLGIGEIAIDRHDSAEWYSGLHRQMRRAINAREPNAGTPGTPGRGGEPDAEAVIRAIVRHRDAEREIPRGSKTAVWRIVVCEDEAGAGHPPTLAALVEALDALTLVRLGASRVRR